MTFIHELPNWTGFAWDDRVISPLLASVRYQQGKLLGKMEALGLSLQNEAQLETLTLDIVKSNEIEGENLERQQVRSSVARRLGLPTAGLPTPSHHIDNVVAIMLDATREYLKPLTKQRLFGWHASLFPGSYSGLNQIAVGKWRKDTKGPMQVVSGSMGKERIHFQAIDAERLPGEMDKFLTWFNKDPKLDPMLKSGLAHLWFVTIHPFEDGNGRIARAIGDLQLCRADETDKRFYSLSTQIQKERGDYYKILELTQRGNTEITLWLEWYLNCINRSLAATDKILSAVNNKTAFWKKFSNVQFNDRQRHMLNKLLDGFHGKLTSTKWAKITKCSHDTALRDIKALLAAEVIMQDDSGGRSTSYSIRQLKLVR
ncbi:MAG: Fic family protein [Verrucomicrobiales bacterium]|jgi:Fic family protein|nr:Fic family protein [Verrucomicrobiales bacterium]